MKKIVLLFIFCLCSILENLNAQYATNVIVEDYRNETVAKKIEQSASQLLTSFNSAFVADKIPALNFGGISKKDKESILTIWEMTPFKCMETEISERLYSTSNGYQIRNIPMFLKSIPEEDAERNIAINFDQAGNILGIYFAIEGADYISIFQSKNDEVTDLRRRQILLGFIENYLTAYYRKDISFINKVFSNEGLIITGSKLKAIKSSGKNRSLPDTIKEYIGFLKNIFANNKYIDIKFNEIKVQRHPKYDPVYGVTLKQSWYTKHYGDVGYLFLCIDFMDENNPLIKLTIYDPKKQIDLQILY